MVARCVRDAKVVGSNPVASTKKEATFVYQKLLLFLSIAKAMAYHQTFSLDIIAAGVSHQPQAVSAFAMMIYNTLC